MNININKLATTLLGAIRILVDNKVIDGYTEEEAFFKVLDSLDLSSEDYLEAVAILSIDEKK